MTLRRAAPDDLDAIMTLERAAFARTAWSDSMMREELASAHNWYVVWEHAGHVRGYGGLRAPRGSKDADIQTIALAEDARGGGRGRALLTALIGEAARRGVREVFLDVRVDNTVAQRLYASEGFIDIGRRPNYYAAEGVDAIVMRLDVGEWAHARTSLRPAEDRARGEDGSGQIDPPTGAEPPLDGGTDAGASP